MIRPLVLTVLLVCFGLVSTNLKAQHDHHAQQGWHGHLHHGTYTHHGSHGIHGSHGHFGIHDQHGFHGQHLNYAHGIGHGHIVQHGYAHSPYGQYQHGPVLAHEHFAPLMVIANAHACQVCQSDSSSIDGNLAYPNMAMPLPNNLGPGAMGPLPSTFAAATPSQVGNPEPFKDNHAGHNHGAREHDNHQHSDHDHANHNHADQNKTNQQHDALAQTTPRLTGPLRTQLLERGSAQILQNDSPLMSGAEQLGTIDRGQVLNVLGVRGNWVQLETNWLGKNAWIRKELVQVSDANQQASEEAAPLAN